MPEKKSSARSLASASPVPLYHQLYLLLKQQILSGEIAHGERLPGEQELMALHHVSRITSRRALAELAAEDLIERGRGRGSYVIHCMTQRPLQGELSAALDNLIAFGRETRVQLLSFERTAPPAALAQLFGTEPKTALVHVLRVRHDSDVPFACLESWTRPPGPRYNRRALQRDLRLELLRACGVVISRFEQTITAIGADAAVAEALKVSVGQPLLAIERLSYDQHGQLADHLRALYRPDRFQLTMSLGAADGDAAI